MSLVPSIANVLVDGIASWKIKNSADAAYHSLPVPRKSNISIATNATANNFKQTIPVSYWLKASAEFMGIRTSADFIKLLPYFSTNLIEHKIALMDGSRIISSDPGTSTPSPTGFGAIKWKLISDKDLDDAMALEISIQRKLTEAEYTQVLTSANTPADGSDPGTDVFHGIDALTYADIVPSGIAKIGLGVSGAGTYADVISTLRKGIFTAELMPAEDGRGMWRSGYINIKLDAEGMETTEAELLKWPAIQFRKNEAQITFANGLVCSLPNTTNNGMGVKTELAVTKDMDDATILKIAGEGGRLPSQWNACWNN